MSCRHQLHALAYNLGNFMRMLAVPKAAEPWSLTSLREKLIKIGAKVVSHGRYVTFQMAEVAVPRQMFQEILSLIARLRAPPAPAHDKRWRQMQQTTAAEVRLDEARATSSGAMRPSESLFWLPTGWLRRISLRCASMIRKIAPNSPGIRGVSAKMLGT